MRPVHHGIAYFAFNFPYRLERYDFSTKSWLPSLALAAFPSALLVADEGIYLTTGSKTSRFDLDLKTETALANLDSEVTVFFAWRDHIFLASSFNDIMSVQRSTGTLAYYKRFDNCCLGSKSKVAVSDGFGKAFFRNGTEIIVLPLGPNGMFGSLQTKVSGNNRSGPASVYIFPDESRVVDGAGLVYTLTDLSFAGDLGGPLNDVTFFESDSPIVLRDNTLIGYSNLLIERGRLQLPEMAQRAILNGTNVFVFSTAKDDLHGFLVDVVPIAKLYPAQTEAIPSMYGLRFAPDNVFIDTEEVVHLFSRAHQVLFRWSAREREELESIRLPRGPQFATYSPENDLFYLAYESGELTQLEPDAQLVERPFAQLSNAIQGLASVGRFVFVLSQSSSILSSSLFGPDGRLLSSTSGVFSTNYVWSEAIRRLFFFRDKLSPNDLLSQHIDSNGEFGATMDSPYHGEIRTLYPIRVRPDGQVLILGSGEIFDALTLRSINSLPTDILDATWRGRTLYTIREFAENTQLEQWSESFAPIAMARFSGKPVRLWVRPSGFILLTIENEQVRFHLLNDSLGFEILFQSRVNSAPDTIAISSMAFSENTPSGTIVARVESRDPDPEDTLRLELQAPPEFPLVLDGGALVVRESIDHETTPAISFSIRATDPFGFALEQAITLTVADTNEAPVAVHLIPSTILESSDVGTAVGMLNVVDPDRMDVHTFELLDDAGGRFRLTGNTIEVAAGLSFADASDHVVRVRAVDRGGLQFESPLAIRVQEFVAAPPLGEVELRFATQTNVVTTNWIESGLSASTHPEPFEIVGATGVYPVPEREGGYLRCGASGQMVRFEHKSGQVFRVFSMELAELSTNQPGTAVEITGRTKTGQEVRQAFVLDGASDGSGPLRDFQTIYLPDSFSDLRELQVIGSAFAIANVSLFVGPPPDRPLVRLQSLRPNSFENESGLPEAPPFSHTARIGVTRVGLISTDLTCQLSLGGTAMHVLDYYVEGLSPQRTVTFAEQQTTAWLELFPIADGLVEKSEFIVLRLEPGTAYGIGRTARSDVTIFDTAFDHWLAARWPGAALTASSEAGAMGDQDGNGLSNIAEFMLGVDPVQTGTLLRPELIVVNGAIHLVLRQNKLASGFEYQLEQSDDLRLWHRLAIPATVLADALTVRTLSYELKNHSSQFFLRLSVRAPGMSP